MGEPGVGELNWSMRHGIRQLTRWTVSRADWRLLAALAVVGCGHVGEDPARPTAAEHSVARDAASEGVGFATLQIDEVTPIGDLTLRWLGVNDSRCPQGVTCFWEGEVVVEIEIILGQERPVMIELKLRPGMEPKVAVVAGHEFRLLSVAPAPVEGEERAPEDLTAAIQVTRVPNSQE